MAESNGPRGDKETKEESDEPEKASEQISRMLEDMKLRLFGGAQPKKEKPPQLLSSLDIEGVVKFIKEGKAKSIITMAGAGISTAAGMPDFRSPGTGLYDNLEEFDLPDKMAVFSIDFFREQPEPFFKVSKQLLPDKYQPTYTHYFLRLLHDKGLLKRHYTQNIDMLEGKAGLPDDKVVYAHGNYQTGHCIVCQQKYEFEWMRDLVMADKVPKCEVEACGGTVKPDIVFFGENLPARFITNFQPDFESAELLIIMGTSLVVMPFAGLVDRVSEEVPRVYINREFSEDSGTNWMALLSGATSGLQCNSSENYRDVFLQGDCDVGCQRLAELLGWKDDLEALYASGHGTDSPGACGDTPNGVETKSPQCANKDSPLGTTPKPKAQAAKSTKTKSQ